jgi:hypothetical protein
VREDLAVGVEDRGRRESFATGSLERDADHDVLDAGLRRGDDRRLLTGEEGEPPVGTVECARTWPSASRIAVAASPLRPDRSSAMPTTTYSTPAFGAAMIVDC